MRTFITYDPETGQILSRHLTPIDGEMQLYKNAIEISPEEYEQKIERSKKVDLEYFKQTKQGRLIPK